MILKNLNDVFPWKLIEIINEKEKENYIVMEYYCTKPGCNCNKVRLVVSSNKWKQYIFDYWWENLEFYTNWMYWDKETAKDLVWLSIDSCSVQSEGVDIIFDILKDLVKKKEVNERFKKHFKMMKGYGKDYDEDNNEDYDEDKLLKSDRNIMKSKIEAVKNKKLKARRKKKLIKKQKQNMRRKK